MVLREVKARANKKGTHTNEKVTINIICNDVTCYIWQGNTLFVPFMNKGKVGNP